MLDFRIATEADADEIVTIVNRAYSPIPGAPGWAGERSFQPGDRTDSSEVPALLSTQRTQILVGARAAGIASCCSISSRDASTTYLGMFAVDPDHQGGGTGRATMMWAESFARTAFGAARMVIDVMEHHEPLRQWYARLGYQPTATRTPFPGSIGADRAHLVEMIKELGAPSHA